MAIERELARDLGAVVARHPEIAAAWVFGSVARGEGRADSDLDVAVLLRAPVERDRLLTLAGELERFSPSGAVDLLVLGEQGPVLRHQVLSEGQLVHEGDHDARIAFEGRTIAEYLDWKPTHDIAMRATLDGLRERFERGAR